MSLRRRLAYIAATLFALLLAFVLLAPVLLRGRIENRVKLAIAKNIDARVDWRSLDLSLIRTFPNLSLQLQDLSVNGVGAFAHDTLLTAPRFRLVLDLGSVLRSLRGRGAIVVRAVELGHPAAKLLVLENGQANWSIFKEKAASQPSSRSFDVSLKRLAITNGRVVLDNRQSGLAASISGLTHTLSGDFGTQRFTLDTHTSADSTSIRFANVPYLANAHLGIDAKIDANTATKTFVLRDNEFKINALSLKAAGSVAARDSSVDVDIAFKTPRTDFREILSLVPTVYAHNFANLKTSGTMSANGRIRGRAGRNVLPSFAIQADVANGAFQYPDLPLPARDISLHLTLGNPGGTADRTVLNVDRFHVVLGSDPIDGALLMRTPVSDPDLGLRVVGKLDLANVPRTIKLDSVRELRGIVVANANMRAKRSDIELRHYDRVSAGGTIEIQRMAVNAAGLKQPLEINDALLKLTPQHAELASFHGRAGTSDMTMNGSLDNLLGFLLRHEVLRGDATLTSRHFDLDEWRSDDELKSIAVPGNIDFALRASADTVKYGALTLRNARGNVRIKDRRATLEDFSMEMLGGAAKVTGFYETIDSIHPAFDVALDFNEVDIPAAFNGLNTVRLFAPVARYAQGQFSARMKLNGALGANMMPVYTTLTALGSLVTNGLMLKDFPVLEKLADVTKLALLHDPGFMDLKSSFAIEKGRLSVKPFDLHTGPLSMTVAGSNGIDQTLDYALGLKLPDRDLGTVHVGGTVTSPVLKVNLREVASNALKPLTARVDSAADEARQKLIAEAEKRAAQIREEADSLASAMRREANARADTLEARSTGLKKIAAKLAADKLRKEADSKADALVREADSRAQAIVDEARKHQ